MLNLLILLKTRGNHMIFRNIFVIILFLYTMFLNIAFANLLDEFKITSDNLTIQKDTSTATFIDNVIVLFDNLELKTSKLIVFYEDTNNKQEITNILIPEKLTAIRDCGKEVVIADTGLFNNPTKQLTLEGNVTLQKEGNILVTNKLIYSSSLIKHKGDAK